MEDSALAFTFPELLDATQRFWDEQLSDRVIHQVVMPLWGIQLPQEALELGDQFGVARLNRDIERTMRRVKFYAVDWVADRPSAYLYYKCLVRKTYGEEEWSKSRKQAIGLGEQAAARFEKILQCLYVLKEGHFERGPWMTIDGGGSIATRHERGSKSGIRNPFRTATYQLQIDEMETLRTLHESLEAAPPKTAQLLAVPLRRFFFAAERERVDDAFVDLMIALEALVSNEAKGEITFRVAQRVALLLGESYAERIRLVKVVNAAYEVRSKLVHGADPPPTVKVAGIQKRLHDFFVEVRGLVRRALQLAVKSALNPDPESDLFNWQWRVLSGAEAPPHGSESN